MLYVHFTMLAVALISLDQWLKWWVTVHIPYTVPMGEPLDLIPGLLGLNHTHNTGGAWSLLNQHTWLLSAVSLLVILAVLLVTLDANNSRWRWAI